MDIPEKLKPYKRIAWKPIIKNADGEVLNSKFAGTPFLIHDEEHPLCLNCNNPMQLFLQLNFEELPSSLNDEFGKGLVQLFYCINKEPLCEVDCEAFFPFAKSVIVRLIQLEHLTSPFKKTLVESSFPPKLIVDWIQTDDYFNWEEGELLGIDLEENVGDALNEENYPQSGDKLAGYPMWVQGVEYPSCKICEKNATSISD